MGLLGVINPVVGALISNAVCVTVGVSGAKTAGLFRR